MHITVNYTIERPHTHPKFLNVLPMDVAGSQVQLRKSEVTISISHESVKKNHVKCSLNI